MQAATTMVNIAPRMAGNSAKPHGISVSSLAQMANDLHVFSEETIRSAILLLMINAAVLGTTAISLSSAWAYGEVRGWPHSLEMPIWKASGFYLIYVGCVALAAAMVLNPWRAVAADHSRCAGRGGIMPPSAIIFLQLLLKDKEVLGREFVNEPWNNWVNWTIIIFLFILPVILAAQVIAPNLFPAT
jgi:Mn2+/Fe2+ NRAMP family transporter